MAKSDLAIVYMAAGMSSRFGGKIKQFARVGPRNETLIEYSINQALKAGFNRIIFIVGNKTEQPFKEIFGSEFKGAKVEYALQTFNPLERDKPWGTVDAVCSLINLVDCPFVVCNGDDIYGESSFRLLADHLRENHINATLGYFLGKVIPDSGATNRGIFAIEGNQVREIKEVFDIEKNNLQSKNLTEKSLCSLNIFALHPNVLMKLKKILDNFREKNKDNRKIECLLPNEISNLIQTGEIDMQIYASVDQWFGVTNPQDEEIVRNQLIELEKKSPIT
jgi:NDP-sugar pyrophosphorylase family protein